MTFSNYLDWRWEKIIVEGVDDHQPLDGRWEHPLDAANANGYANYYFNVPGDNCRGYNGKPCYTVGFGGNPASSVSISFSRDGSYSDQNTGHGTEVFKSVLKAVGEYIKALKPAALQWSPVSKTTTNPVAGKIINADARKNIYDKWSIRHLFPNKYVGLANKWIRRDIYDSDYVTKGFPPVPTEISADSPPGTKAKALEDMRVGIEANKAEIARLQQERETAERRRQEQEQEARRREQEREAAERLAAALQDPAQNPHGVAKDDVVFIHDHNSTHESEYTARIGKITDLRISPYHRGEHNVLTASVKFIQDENDEEFRGYSESLPARRLKKETPEEKASREQLQRDRLADLVNSQNHNPHGVQEGDSIITVIEGSPTSNQNGLLGTLKKFIREVRWGETNLTAKIDWDAAAVAVIGAYNAERPINPKSLRKATPEQIASIHRARREHEIEQEVQRNRTRQQRHIAAADQPGTAEAFPEELLNHPGNPNHLRPGDYVVISGHWQHRGRKGIIQSIKKRYYDDTTLEAEVKFHNSRTRWNPTFTLNSMERDTSAETLELQTRAQNRAARAQQVASNTGGHEIGDEVTVASGLHRTKTGRIINFRRSGTNVTAVVQPLEGTSFNVSVRSLRPPLRIAQPTESPSAEGDGPHTLDLSGLNTPTESYRPLSFTEYFTIRSQEPVLLL